MTSKINISNMNSVNGSTLNSSTSLGTGSYVRRVNLDRHHATVVKIETWNVRTMFQSGKLDNIKLEMDRLGVNIMGISEVRWRGARIIDTNGYKFVFSGGQRHENGVGFILDRERAKGMLGYWAISDRVVLLKMKGSPLSRCMLQHPTALTKLLRHSMKTSKKPTSSVNPRKCEL